MRMLPIFYSLLIIIIYYFNLCSQKKVEYFCTIWRIIYCRWSHIDVWLSQRFKPGFIRFIFYFFIFRFVYHYYICIYIYKVMWLIKWYHQANKEEEKKQTKQLQAGGIEHHFCSKHAHTHTHTLRVHYQKCVFGSRRQQWVEQWPLKHFRSKCTWPG